MNLRSTKRIEWTREGDCFRSTNHSFSTCGYPQMQRNKRYCSIARHILIRRIGDLPGVHARHTCDHKWCIRPDHIISGTNADNMKDKVGRIIYRRGDKHGNAKLTDGQVAHIRHLLDYRHLTHREIADIFGVHPTTISKIKRNCNRRKPPSLPDQNN